MACRFRRGGCRSWRGSWPLRGWTGGISHEGLRVLLREQGVTCQRLKTWKPSKDPDYAVKTARAGHLYAIAGREVVPGPGEPEVVFCVDEFGPLNLQPRPGRQPAAIGGTSTDPGPAAAAPDTRHLYPHRGCPASAGGL